VVIARRSRVIVGAALALTGLGAAWVLLHAPREQTPFHLCVVHAHKPPQRALRLRWSRTMIAAVGLATNADERGQIEPILDASTTRWEARANPLLEDFEDDDPDAALAAWFASGPAYVGTAMAASKTDYCGADGFCVRVVPNGAPCPSGSSVPANEADRGRASFLAWPFAHAVFLRVPADGDARATADVLRAAARKSTQIGLVIAGTDEEAERSEPYATLGERWRRHETWKLAAREDGGTDGPDEKTPVFPAFLEARDVIVLPRFEAIRSPGRLRDEVRGLAPRAYVAAAAN
jgi:hypothetical protein